ncbi:hypothetical protein D9611_007866 [Ephemerocybe angulata]|uniref:WW domain-containing protein n=1 Tax=Ephemerocybe angulata TaxID=980116 RepID=A0A8H5FL33_9AGAR|nr:hypothetical protein D9611_007866 [Tulosesus angulatus]
MDDVDNEVLDWENEDDEQHHQPQNGRAAHQDVEDVDADDAVSLGDDDEQLSLYEEPQAQQIPQTSSSGRISPHEDRRRNHESSQPTFTAPQRGDQYRSDRDRSRVGGSDHRDRDRDRRRSFREPSPRSRAPPPGPPRLTHALPPKPVEAAAVAEALAAPLKGHLSRASIGDSHSANGMSPSSPNHISLDKHESIGEWEARTSSKGDTFYYNLVTFESTWKKPASLHAVPARESGIQDARRGRHTVSSSGFRSSPTHSDNVASQDYRPSRLEDEGSRKHPRDARSDPLTLEDRTYRPADSEEWTKAVFGDYIPKNGEETDAIIAAADPRANEPPRSPSSRYSRGRERESIAHFPEREHRDRVVSADNESREQKSRAQDDSHRRSRNPNKESYAISEDRPAPSFTGNRRSSPPRGPMEGPRDRHPNAASSTLSASCNHLRARVRSAPGNTDSQTLVEAVRRRLSPDFLSIPVLPYPAPSRIDSRTPSTASPFIRRRPSPGPPKQSYERSAATSLPPANTYRESTRDSREERPSRSREIPTGPAPQKDYAPRSTNSRRHEDEPGHEVNRATRNAWAEMAREEEREATRRAEIVKVSQQANGAAGFHRRERASYPQFGEDLHPPSRVQEGFAKISLREERSITEQGRGWDEPRWSNRDEMTVDESTSASYERESRNTTRVSPTLEPGRSRPRSRERVPAEVQRVPYTLPEKYPEAPLASKVPERVSRPTEPRQHRAPVIDDARALPSGPSSRVVEDAYGGRAARSSRNYDEIPAGPRRVSPPASTTPREPRRTSSPKKNPPKQPARKLASGTNDIPLGKNRFDPPAVPQPPPALPAPATRQPPTGPAPNRYPAAGSNPNIAINRPALSERQPPTDTRQARSGFSRPVVLPPAPRDTAPHPRVPVQKRPATPPPQDYERRVSDPHFVPPHMVERRSRDGDKERDVGMRESERNRWQRDRTSRNYSPPPPPLPSVEPRLPGDGGPMSASHLGRAHPSGSPVVSAGPQWGPPFPPTRPLEPARMDIDDNRYQRSGAPTVPINRASYDQHAYRGPSRDLPSPVDTNPPSSSATSHNDRSRSSRWDPPTHNAGVPTNPRADIESARTRVSHSPVSPTTSRKQLDTITPPRLRRPDPSPNDRRPPPTLEPARAIDLATSGPIAQEARDRDTGVNREREREQHRERERRERERERERDAPRRSEPLYDREARPPSRTEPPIYETGPPRTSMIYEREPVYPRGPNPDPFEENDRKGRPQPPPSVARTGSLLDRLEPILDTSNGTHPPLRDRVSGASIPSKRDLEEMRGVDGREEKMMVDDSYKRPRRGPRKGTGHGRRH